MLRSNVILHILQGRSRSFLYISIKGFCTKEGPYQDRPPLCPFRLLPLLTCS